MAKWRPAVPCHARRSNGSPCGNYAMHGGMVCHAHGGRARQVRRAAFSRRREAQARRYLAELSVEREARRAAIAPWAQELQDARWEFDRTALARRYRRIAREMTAVAKALRAEARQVEEGDT